MQNRYEGNNHFKILRLNFRCSLWLLCVRLCKLDVQHIQRSFSNAIRQKTFMFRNIEECSTFANKSMHTNVRTTSFHLNLYFYEFLFNLSLIQLKT